MRRRTNRRKNKILKNSIPKIESYYSKDDNFQNRIDQSFRDKYKLPRSNISSWNYDKHDFFGIALQKIGYTGDGISVWTNPVHKEDTVYISFQDASNVKQFSPKTLFDVPVKDFYDIKVGDRVYCYGEQGYVKEQEAVSFKSEPKYGDLYFDRVNHLSYIYAYGKYNLLNDCLNIPQIENPDNLKEETTNMAKAEKANNLSSSDKKPDLDVMKQETRKFLTDFEEYNKKSFDLMLKEIKKEIQSYADNNKVELLSKEVDKAIYGENYVGVMFSLQVMDKLICADEKEELPKKAISYLFSRMRRAEKQIKDSFEILKKPEVICVKPLVQYFASFISCLARVSEFNANFDNLQSSQYQNFRDSYETYFSQWEEICSTKIDQTFDCHYDLQGTLLKILRLRDLLEYFTGSGKKLQEYREKLIALQDFFLKQLGTTKSFMYIFHTFLKSNTDLELLAERDIRLKNLFYPFYFGSEEQNLSNRTDYSFYRDFSRVVKQLRELKSRDGILVNEELSSDDLPKIQYLVSRLFLLKTELNKRIHNEDLYQYYLAKDKLLDNNKENS